MKRFLKHKLGAGMLLSFVAGVVATVALAAANVVPSASLGLGTGTVSGYTATAVGYTTNGANPQNLDAVNFTITPNNPSVVKIQLVAAGSWYSCVVTPATGATTCATTSPQATVAATTQLSVLATQ